MLHKHREPSLYLDEGEDGFFELTPEEAMVLRLKRGVSKKQKL